MTGLLEYVIVKGTCHIRCKDTHNYNSVHTIQKPPTPRAISAFLFDLSILIILLFNDIITTYKSTRRYFSHCYGELSYLYAIISGKKSGKVITSLSLMGELSSLDNCVSFGKD